MTPPVRTEQTCTPAAPATDSLVSSAVSARLPTHTTCPRYWLCAATQSSIKIWDLESKSVVDDLRPEFSKTYGKKAIVPYCVSIAWSADGGTLFAGYTDGIIRVFTVSHGM